MNKTRFLYHAQAVGLSGKITRPFEQNLDVQAVSAIPSSGGYSSARINDVRIREIFHCPTVHSETTGSFNEKNDSHDTSATATAEGFNLSDVVTAQVITARVSSSHAAGRDEEPSIRALGTSIQGLRIAGRDIELESLVDDFSELDTMTKLRERYKKDDGFRKRIQETAMIGRRSELADERLHRFFPWCHRKPTDELPEFRHTTILPLFRILNPSAPGFRVIGNVVHVENFGRIHIGELVVSGYERRVNLLHVNLGSPVDGDVDACAVGGNGSTNDPPPDA
jgi:hypothetical protein